MNTDVVDIDSELGRAAEENRALEDACLRRKRKWIYVVPGTLVGTFVVGMAITRAVVALASKD